MVGFLIASYPTTVRSCPIHNQPITGRTLQTWLKNTPQNLRKSSRIILLCWATFQFHLQLKKITQLQITLIDHFSKEASIFQPAMYQKICLVAQYHYNLDISWLSTGVIWHGGWEHKPKMIAGRMAKLNDRWEVSKSVNSVKSFTHIEKKNHVGWFNRSVFCFKSEEHVFFASEPPLGPSHILPHPRVFSGSIPSPRLEPAQHIRSSSVPLPSPSPRCSPGPDLALRCRQPGDKIFPTWWKPGGYSSQRVKIDENLVSKPLEWWFFPINPRLGQRPAVHLRGQRSMFPSIKINTWLVKTYEPTIFDGINIYEPAVSG